MSNLEYRKKDGQRYTFEYIRKEDMPDNCKKSANIRPRMTDEERKKRQKEYMNREYTCQKCGNSYKNSYKYQHNKRCL